MAAEKTASVRLTLNGQNYVAELKRVGAENEKTTEKVKSGWQRAGLAGLKSMKDAASGMMASVRSTVSMVGALGGAVSLAGAVKGAIDMRKEFRAIAFDVQAANGQIVDARAIMQDASAAAQKWGIDSSELGQAFKEVNAETGNLDYAKSAMQAIAVTARGTGANVETLARIAGSMGEKFGVGGKEAEDALAVAYGMSRQANIPLEEMDAVIDRIGSSAKSLGIQGVGGFQKVMGMATIAKESTKGMRGALMATMQLMEQMADPGHRKKMMVAFGVDVKGKSYDQALEAIIKKTGGKRELLAKGFEGEQLKVVTELGGVFKGAFEGASGTVQQKTKVALEAYRKNLAEASHANLNAAKVAERAAKNVEGPQAQMAIAMEKLKVAFTSPEMMNGLLRLAKIAPEAANKLAKLMEVAFNHPYMAAGIFAGLKLGVPLLRGAFTEGAKVLGGKLKDSLISGMTGKGGGAGAGIGMLGKAGMVAGAGAIGFGIGEAAAEAIENYSSKPLAEIRGGLQGATAATDVNATGKVNLGALEASAAELEKRLAKAKEERSFHASDIFTLGLRRISTASNAEVEKGEAALAKAKERIAAEKTAKGFDMVADAASRAADRLAKVAPEGGDTGRGGASRGAPRRPPAAPGYAPR